MSNLSFENWKGITGQIMGITENDNYITLNATELEKKIIERYGLQACGIIEAIRDCEINQECKENTENEC